VGLFPLIILVKEDFYFHRQTTMLGSKYWNGQKPLRSKQFDVFFSIDVKLPQRSIRCQIYTLTLKKYKRYQTQFTLTLTLTPSNSFS
jgi:hypothetical protein